MATDLERRAEQKNARRDKKKKKKMSISGSSVKNLAKLRGKK
jgi:hypothetical protein